MNRSLFFALLGCVLWLAHATPGMSQGKVPRIGFLTHCLPSFDDQVSKVDLVVDLRLARETGIKVPQELLYRADEIIQ